MHSTSIKLTSTLETFVSQQVESGLYGNRSEVIREGLRLLYAQRQEQKLMALREALLEGEASGRAEPWDKDAFLAEMDEETAE